MAIGLSVDYAAHIAHCYLVSKGTKTQRATHAFVSISPAVIHGGISTFLAVIPIGGFTQSHASITFFRMVSLTVFFGLYHGLLFLPVLLTFFGTDTTEKEDIQMGVNPKSTSDRTWSDQSEEVNNSCNGTDNPSYETDKH